MTSADETSPPGEAHSGRPQVYSPKSLANEWLCSEKHIRNLIASNELRAFKVGGKLLRISAAAVDDFERSHAVGFGVQ